MKKSIVLSAENCFLYEKCQEAWWPALDAHTKQIRIRKGQQIFTEGEKVSGIYFMVEGVVKVHKRWSNDKELIVRFAQKKDILGHRGLTTHTDIYPISATALTDAVVCFIDLPFFFASLKVNAALAHDMMMFFADELMLSEQNLQVLANLHVKGRLARLLVSLEKKFGVDENGAISFPVSRQDMASCISTVYETVYKLLLEFTDAGWVETNGKHLILKNKAALKELFQSPE